MHLVCNVKSTSKMPEAGAKVSLLFHDCGSLCHSDCQGRNKGSWAKLIIEPFYHVIFCLFPSENQE